MAVAIPFVMMGLAAYSAISSAQAQQQAGQQAQQIANSNADILSQRATQAQNEAQARAAIQARSNARTLGATKAAYGASGVDVNEGTPLEVLSDQATEGELQRQLILYGGQTQSNAYQQQANILRMGGAVTAGAANTAAGNTLLTGALKVGMTAYGAYGGGSGTTSSGIDKEIANWSNYGVKGATTY